MSEYKYIELKSIYKAILYLLSITLIFDLISSVSAIFDYTAYVGLQNGVMITESQLHFMNVRDFFLVVFGAIISLSTIIFYCKWTFRICNNAHCASDRHFDFTPTEAVVYYFIPILNIWKPYRALKEAFVTFTEETKDEVNTSILLLWWFAWIISGLLLRVIYFISKNTEEVNEALFNYKLFVGSELFSLLLDVLAIVVVIKVTNACVKYYENIYTENDIIS